MSIYETLFVTSNILAVIRIFTYQRGESSYKASVSIIAYVLAVSLMGQVIAAMGDARTVTPWDSILSISLCTLLFRAQGNVAKLVWLRQ